MRLAVAGLDKKAVTKHLQRLAGGDWSSFRPADRVAFRFARKHAKEPATISQEDFDGLVQHFGEQRALDVIFWSCHCHYLTRVADAFQLPLERRNVFDGFLPEGP